MLWMISLPLNPILWNSSDFDILFLRVWRYFVYWRGNINILGFHLHSSNIHFCGFHCSVNQQKWMFIEVQWYSSIVLKGSLFTNLLITETVISSTPRKLMSTNIGETTYDMELKINLGDYSLKDYIIFTFYVKNKNVSLWTKWIIRDSKNDIICKSVR